MAASGNLFMHLKISREAMQTVRRIFQEGLSCTHEWLNGRIISSVFIGLKADKSITNIIKTLPIPPTSRVIQ